MKHLSCTQRVTLEWLFDRINLDPMIHAEHVDTRGQLAGTLTKGSFTRNEWNQPLQKLNTMGVSLLSRSHFSSRMHDSEAIPQRQMLEKGHGEQTMRAMAKSRIARNLVPLTPSGWSPPHNANFFLFSWAMGELLRGVPVRTEL